MQHESKGAFYSGTSGIVLPVSNKEFFPAEFKEKSRLEYYASLFSSVEINSSFYKVPMASTVSKWAENVPENFRFTFKLWREITHNRGLTFQEKDVFHFMDTISQAAHKKGCILVQFPPSLKIGMFSALQKLILTIREADQEEQWKTVLEFRDYSWYHDEVYEFIEHLGMGIVIHDKPSSRTPLIDSSVMFKYLRFHGPNGDYKGHYSDDFLYDYAELINQWKGEERDVYCYFNNTAGDAVHNLISLNTFVSDYME